MGIHNANAYAGVALRWVCLLGVAFGLQFPVDTLKAQSYPYHAQSIGGSDWGITCCPEIVDGYKWKLGNGIPSSSAWHVNETQMHSTTLYGPAITSGQCYRLTLDPFDFSPDNPSELNIAYRVYVGHDMATETQIMHKPASDDPATNYYVEFTVDETVIPVTDYVTIEVFMQGKNELATVGIASFDFGACGGGSPPGDPDPDPPADESDWPDGGRILRVHTECGVWLMDWKTYKNRDGEVWEKIHTCALGHGGTASFTTYGESPFDPVHIQLMDGETTVEGNPFTVEWEPGVESPAAQELLDRIIGLYPGEPGSAQPGQAADPAALTTLTDDIPACDGDCAEGQGGCCYSVQDSDKDGIPDALDETPYGGNVATGVPVGSRFGEITAGAGASIPIGSAPVGLGDSEFSMILPISIPGFQSPGFKLSTYADQTFAPGAALDTFRILCRAFALMCFSAHACTAIITTIRQW